MGLNDLRSETKTRVYSTFRPLRASGSRESTELVMKEIRESEADIESLCDNMRLVSSNTKARSRCSAYGQGLSTKFGLIYPNPQGRVNPSTFPILVNSPSRRELVVKAAKATASSPLGLGSFLCLSLATRRLTERDEFHLCCTISLLRAITK